VTRGLPLRSSVNLLRFVALLLLSGCSPDALPAVELERSTLSRDLLAHWTFDEQSGAIAHDDSGNARDGQVTGGTWLSDGQFGGALRLGSGELVSVPRFPDVAASFTVSAWVRLASYTQASSGDDQYTTVISTENSGGWEVNIDKIDPSPKLHFGFWKGPNTGDYVGQSCPGLVLERWTQVVGIVDTSSATASIFSIYLDGQLAFTTTTPHKIQPGSPTLTIGAWPNGGRFLVGDVDEIAIWARALVPAEVSLLTQTPPPTGSANP